MLTRSHVAYRRRSLRVRDGISRRDQRCSGPDHAFAEEIAAKQRTGSRPF